MSAKACLISCSDHYNHRLKLWDNGLRKLQYSTRYVTSNFDHTAKTHYLCQVPDCVQIPVMAYRKNLSVQRILSHYQFAKRVYSYLEAEKPDVIVALLPPNFLAKYLAHYKCKHPNVRLIFDIFDLWPETFPAGKAKTLLYPVFRIWAGLRDRILPAADYVTTECDLFRELLQLSQRSRTVYLGAESVPVAPAPSLPQDALSLCYLGAINNIIDIPGICSLIRDAAQYRPVLLHIIGKGERQQELIDSAKASGAQVIFHGAVYDTAEKQRIMDSCHFGLNILKRTVCIGLTMKSVDYFRHGLPIINTIPADTERLLQAHDIGITMGPDCAKQVCSIDNATNLAMRQRVLAVFEANFSESVIQSAIDGILTEVVRCV